MLGIFQFYYYPEYKFLEILRQLQNAQLHLPVVFALGYSAHNVLYRIVIFPAFYHCHPAIRQILAKSFDEVQGSNNASAIDAYLVDSCNLPSIQVLTENITTMVPNITSLIFYVHDPCEIVNFFFFGLP